MATDREVLRELWEGKIPTCFMLYSEEYVDVQAPEPYYLLVPRLSYFPLVTDKVRKHFISSVAVERKENEMWLEFNGIPLKWHYPIGLLFDMNQCDIELPWNIIVHFDKFPDDQLLHCPNRETVESYFMSSLKEADALKHKVQVVSNMQKKDHNQLWQGLQNDKFEQFWAVNRKLMVSCGDAGGGENGFRHVPVRCYYRDEPLVQRLVRAFGDDGERRTLSDLLAAVYPDKDTSQWQVITHGIEPPRETPLQWMSEHLSYPDNFLHLYIQPKS